MNQPPLMSDAEVFGADHPMVYGQGAPESGRATTPEQKAYATAAERARDVNAPVGSPSNPSYDTPSVTGSADIYHVTSGGQMMDPQSKVDTGAHIMSDADVFGVHAAPGATPPALPTSESLGVAVGANNVIKSYIDAARGGLPKLPGQTDGPLTGGDILTLLPRIAEGFAQSSLDKQSLTTRPGTIGKIAGEALASAPLAVDAEAPAIMGAIQGWLTSDKAPDDIPGRLADTGMGMIGGKIGDKVLGAVKGAILPTISKGAQWAADNGIRLTPGAILGGFAKGVESGAAKGTIAGPMVSNAQRQMITDANLAATNNALKPAGLALPDGVAAGTAAIDKAHTIIGGAYDALAPKLTVTRDAALTERLGELSGLGANLDPPLATRYQGLIDKLNAGFDQNGQMPGAEMRKLDSFYGQQQRRFSKSDDPFHQEYADAISDLQDTLRDATERSNPAHAGQLSGLNSGYAQLVRLDKAAVLAKQNDGVWTPNQLMQAVTSGSMDSSARQTSSARGRALLQDWAKSAKDVLPNTMPNAGSFMTHLPELLVTAGVGHEAGLPVVGKMLATEGALAGAYTPPVQAALRTMLTKRPAGAQGAANVAEGLRPLLSWLSATAAGQAPGALPALPDLTAAPR